ncbi:MAG TPA: LacI family DNA-binding transcriptional regulator [Trebonia sp.]|nr:LacI family DNA-binding transcriptional regulator [Trebonia sp.]
MTRIVGIKDVAQDAGVSVGTVSNAINRPDLVAPETRDRVVAAIERLGYVRSEAARSLRAGTSRIIGQLVLDMANPFFAEVAAGAARAAVTAGLRVMLCNSDNDPAEEAAYLSLFAEQRVRGVLLTPADPSGAELSVLRRHEIPFVLVDRVTSEGCSVSVDDVAGGRMAGAHLVETGHEHIAYVSGPMTFAQCRDRRDGALAALTAHGLPEDALALIEADRMDVASGREAGRALLQLARRPSAVFCANDLLALGLLQTMYAAGVSVPGEMAIIGYDDIEFAGAAAVPLSSVRQPSSEMGQMAAGLLVEEISAAPGQHRHRRVVLEPELVVRESTRMEGAQASAPVTLPPARAGRADGAGGRRPKRAAPRPPSGQRI